MFIVMLLEFGVKNFIFTISPLENDIQNQVEL